MYGLSADGRRAAVATGTADRIAIWNVTELSIWLRGTAGTCGDNPGAIWDPGLSGTRAAWTYERDEHHPPDAGLWTASPGVKAGLLRWADHTADNYLGNLAGDGPLLVYNTWRGGDGDGTGPVAGGRRENGHVPDDARRPQRSRRGRGRRGTYRRAPPRRHIRALEQHRQAAELVPPAATGHPCGEADRSKPGRARGHHDRGARRDHRRDEATLGRPAARGNLARGRRGPNSRPTQQGSRSTCCTSRTAATAPSRSPTKPAPSTRNSSPKGSTTRTRRLAARSRAASLSCRSGLWPPSSGRRVTPPTRNGSSRLGSPRRQRLAR